METDQQQGSTKYPNTLMTISTEEAIVPFRQLKVCIMFLFLAID